MREVLLISGRWSSEPLSATGQRQGPLHLQSRSLAYPESENVPADACKSSLSHDKSNSACPPSCGGGGWRTALKKPSADCWSCSRVVKWPSSEIFGIVGPTGVLAGPTGKVSEAGFLSAADGICSR
jgi:hypothetical protein